MDHSCHHRHHVHLCPPSHIRDLFLSLIAQSFDKYFLLPTGNPESIQTWYCDMLSGLSFQNYFDLYGSGAEGAEAASSVPEFVLNCHSSLSDRSPWMWMV